MQNLTELLDSHALPINMNEYPPGNIFTSKYKSILQSLLAVPKKPSLPTNNALESTKNACNWGNPSQNDFKGQSLINALNKFDAKIITNITFIKGFYSIVLLWKIMTLMHSK